MVDFNKLLRNEEYGKMAKQKEIQEGLAGLPIDTRNNRRMRSFKNEGKKMTSLEEGDSISGIFIGVRLQEITEIRPPYGKKTIRVYSVRSTNEDGEVYKIGGRALLDSCFDDVMDEMGGYDIIEGRLVGAGVERIKGKAVQFNRGQDIKTRGGDRMGTYEILVEE